MKLRPPRDEDFDAIVAVVNAGPRAAYGEDEYSAEEMRNWLTSPKIDLQRDVRVVELDGRIVGYVDIDSEGEDPVRWWSDLKVDSDVDAPAVLGALVGWLEERAEGGVLRAWNPSEVEHVGPALEGLGFWPIRHSFRMAIELGAETESPAWPEGISVRMFEAGEEQAVFDIFHETWQDTLEPSHDAFTDWAHWWFEREGFDPSLWFLACEGDEIAGFSLCRAADTRQDTGIVHLLGVRKPWRRRGVGEALLRHSFAEFHRRGLARVALGVDADSPTGAPRLYERVGMSVVRRVDFYEKSLDP